MSEEKVKDPERLIEGAAKFLVILRDPDTGTEFEIARTVLPANEEQIAEFIETVRLLSIVTAEKVIAGG